MPGEIMVVTIVAMCLGYSLLRHLILAISGQGRKATGRGHGRACSEQVPKPEHQDALQAKARDLVRRIDTLEEIMAAETRSAGANR